MIKKTILIIVLLSLILLSGCYSSSSFEDCESACYDLVTDIKHCEGMSVGSMWDCIVDERDTHREYCFKQCSPNNVNIITEGEKNDTKN